MADKQDDTKSTDTSATAKTATGSTATSTAAKNADPAEVPVTQEINLAEEDNTSTGGLFEVSGRGKRVRIE